MEATWDVAGDNEEGEKDESIGPRRSIYPTCILICDYESHGGRLCGRRGLERRKWERMKNAESLKIYPLRE